MWLGPLSSEDIDYQLFSPEAATYLQIMKPSGDRVRRFFSRRGRAPLGLISAHCLGTFLTLPPKPLLNLLGGSSSPHKPTALFEQDPIRLNGTENTFPLTDVNSNIQVLDSELALPVGTLEITCYCPHQAKWQPCCPAGLMRPSNTSLTMSVRYSEIYKYRS